MPVAVFIVGCVFGTEKYSSGTFANMMVVSLGVAIASYGELYYMSRPPSVSLSISSMQCSAYHFSRASVCWSSTSDSHVDQHICQCVSMLLLWASNEVTSCAAGELNFIVIGVVLQMCSICTESTRLVLVQILLQRRGLKLNPITTLYYIAPCCFGFLLLPFIMLEAPKIMNDPAVTFSPFVLLTNASAAFGTLDSYVHSSNFRRIDISMAAWAYTMEKLFFVFLS